jgi:hypothetical protein
MKERARDPLVGVNSVEKIPVQFVARSDVLGFDVGCGELGLHSRTAGSLQRRCVRLCSADIPDVDGVTACMVRKQDQLSPVCRCISGRPSPNPRSGRERLNIKPAVSRKPVSESQ